MPLCLAIKQIKNIFTVMIIAYLVNYVIIMIRTMQNHFRLEDGDENNYYDIRLSGAFEDTVNNETGAVNTTMDIHYNNMNNDEDLNVNHSNISTDTTSSNHSQQEQHDYTTTNMHQFLGQFTCGDNVPEDQINPSMLALLEMVNGYNDGQHNGIGHSNFYTGPLEHGVKKILYLQVCSYTLLNRFWDLTKEFNITSWSAHGGALMGAMCHQAINPWDDDIDITVSSCEPLEEIFSKGASVAEKYPNMKKRQHTVQGWEGRLIDDKYILIRGPSNKPKGNWFKLKAVAQILTKPTQDLGGMDIQCLDERVSFYEKGVMEKSGYRDALLHNEQELQVVEFGPTRIKLVPDHVGKEYVLQRYGKEEFCDFPFDKTSPRLPTKSFENLGRAVPPVFPSFPREAFHLHEAIGNWYISPNTRNKWLLEMGKTPGNELNKQVPNLNKIEIDNYIAAPQSCRIGKKFEESNEKQLLKVIGFNAGRGTYWAEFAEMVEKMSELEQPDLIILNEMDIGMARSGNVHTTRKLAFRLGMNYAWGLEFVELSNGNWEEQNQTIGMENAMGLHGNAILSRCAIYDPIIFRDNLDERYFSDKKFSGNAHGSEKRLGGRMGLFVRTGGGGSFLRSSTNSNTPPEAPHVIVGSVHKLEDKTHRKKIWEYLDFGPFPNITERDVVSEKGVSRNNNTIGIVISGDLAARTFCTQSGLNNLDKPQRHKTFPADCETQRLGHWRGDQFCGNMKVHGDDQSVLPCYNKAMMTRSHDNDSSASFNGTTIQISDHSIIEFSVEMN